MCFDPALWPVPPLAHHTQGNRLMHRLAWESKTLLGCFYGPWVPSFVIASSFHNSGPLTSAACGRIVNVMGRLRRSPTLGPPHRSYQADPSTTNPPCIATDIVVPYS